MKTSGQRSATNRNAGTQQQKEQGPNRFQKTSSTIKDEIPILRYGPDNNFHKFKEKLSRVALERYGNMATFIETDKEYDVPAVDTSLYPNRATDDVEKALYLEECKLRVKELAKIREEKPKLYAMIISRLSHESSDELKRHPKYAVFNSTKDPVQLWLAVKELHLVATTSKVEGAIKAAARYNYTNCKQGPYESIISYKERFDYALEAYNKNGNPPMSDEDIAMDFLNNLDAARYDDLKVEVINDLAKKVMQPLKDLTEVYILASRRVVKKTTNIGTGVSFATADSVRKKKPPEEVKRDDGKIPSEVSITKQKVDNDNVSKAGSGTKKKLTEEETKCWICNKIGHFARNCTEDGDSVSKLSGSSKKKFGGVTFVFNSSEHHVTDDDQPRWQPWEILLDECSEVSVVHPSLLRNIRKQEGVGFKGLYSGSQKDLSLVGDLEGFFPCQACTDCSANILCGAAVEDLYPIMYVQGVSKTVHMAHRDLVFVRKGMFYVGDFRDWLEDRDYTSEIHDDDTHVISNTSSYVYASISSEELYTSKEVKKAKEAGDFIAKAGYPSLEEAIHMVTDGNIMGLSIDSSDVRRYFNLYGPHTAGVKGKTTTPSHPSTPSSPDPALKEQISEQTMIADIMDIDGQKFLVSLSLPLGLLAVSYVTS